ncbi:unnamed protein product [Orchesella dallaii]|uniref:Uncharacterized protein n=1 Tax=Orchesella dallaii TaxID=48710 RepID=A0ABP1S6L5_9HEXA
MNSFYDRLPNLLQDESPVQYLHHRGDSHRQQRHSDHIDEKLPSVNPYTSHLHPPHRFSFRDQLSNLRFHIRRSVDYAISLRGFHQQRLPSWEPVLNCLSVGKFVLGISLVLTTLWMAAIIVKKPSEIAYSYDSECKNANDYVWAKRQSCILCSGKRQSCKMQIRVPEDIKVIIIIQVIFVDRGTAPVYDIRQTQHYKILFRVFSSSVVMCTSCIM